MTQSATPGEWPSIAFFGPVMRLVVLVPESWQAWLVLTPGPVWYIFTPASQEAMYSETPGVIRAISGGTAGRLTG